jgi:hypothetical protein
MYIDEEVLKIIFQVPADDKEAMDAVISSYYDGVAKLSVQLIQEYLTNPKMPKPKVKGFMKALELSEEDIKNMPEEEYEDISAQVMLAAISSPYYRVLFNKAMDVYTDSIVKAQMPSLSAGEKKALQDYLEKTEQKIKKNEEIYIDALDEFKKEIEQGNVEPITFSRDN